MFSFFPTPYPCTPCTNVHPLDGKFGNFVIVPLRNFAYYPKRPDIGFDGSLPIDSMQGLEIGSQHGSNYGPPMDHMDMSGAPPHFEGIDNSGMAPPPNQQNPDQNQMAAWFDTDL